LPRLLFKQIRHLLQHIIEPEGSGMQGELTRFDLRHIQNIVDNAQQHLRG